jgi:hypothetical protein
MTPYFCIFVRISVRTGEAYRREETCQWNCTIRSRFCSICHCPATKPAKPEPLTTSQSGLSQSLLIEFTLRDPQYTRAARLRDTFQRKAGAHDTRIMRPRPCLVSVDRYLEFARSMQKKVRALAGAYLLGCHDLRVRELRSFVILFGGLGKSRKLRVLIL